MDSTAMSWREHVRQNMQLALPLMIDRLATIDISTSDTIAMRWIDSSNLATGALASRFYQPFFFLALGVSPAVGTPAGFSIDLGATGVWDGVLLGLSLASLILTMRIMLAMQRIRDGGRILFT